jgi:hypothetical protein
MVVMPKRPMKLAALPWNTLSNKHEPKRDSYRTFAYSLTFQFTPTLSPFAVTAYFPKELPHNVCNFANYLGAAISPNYIDILCIDIVPTTPTPHVLSLLHRTALPSHSQ